MRTTLTIRDELYEAVRRQAFEERRGISEVFNELVAAGLNSSSQRSRTLGAFAGLITVADDFDDEIDDIARALDEPVQP